MSTHTATNSRLTAACTELMARRLDVPLPALQALPDLAAAIAGPHLPAGLGGHAALPALQALAPAHRVDWARSGTPAFDDQLRAAAAAATAAAAAATRAVIADAAERAAAALGYCAVASHGDTASGVEMRRGHELMLVTVNDDGTVEADHAGLADATCDDRQRAFEQALTAQGVELSGTRRAAHRSRRGGVLIAAAARRGGPSLAEAAVRDADARRARGTARLFPPPAAADPQARTARSAR